MDKEKEIIINDYLSHETLSLSKKTSVISLIEILASLSLEQKERLVTISEELKKFGSEIPLHWAIQDLEYSFDYGGSAYFTFIQTLIDNYKNTNKIITEIIDSHLTTFIDKQTNENKQLFHEFLQIYGLYLTVSIIEIIESEEKNNLYPNLRRWKLFATDAKGNPICKIQDLPLWREHIESFYF